MSDLRELTPEALKELCAQNSEMLAEALQSSLETGPALQAGEAADWKPDELPEGFGGPGLIVSIGVGEQAMLVAVPEAFPLPEWYRNPTKSQNSRTQTLAMELAPSLLPLDFDPGEQSVVAVDDLRAALESTAPSEDAHLLLLTPVGDSDQSEEGESATGHGLLILWPVGEPAKLSEQNVITVAEEEPAPAPAAAAAPTPFPAAAAASRPLQQMLKTPVEVSVRLAEKKIELENLLMLSAGSLITFNKPCDDLLELYVNNCRYALGEAVKIDENFGMKVTEVGVRPVRESRIIE